MIASFNQLIWFASVRDSALQICALCGDEVMAPNGDGVWLKPTSVSRGAGIMLLTYQGGGCEVGFCVVAPASVTAQWVANLRADLSVEGAERRWGPFISLLGRYESAAALATPAAWVESATPHAGDLWRVRRRRHHSALIDHLSQRDRMEGEQRVRAALGLATCADAEAARGGPALSERGSVLH